MALLRQRESVRLLDERDASALNGLLDTDPVTHCFVSSRVASAGLDSWRNAAETWGLQRDGQLVAACWSGANLVPVNAGPSAVRAFADRALRQGRRCSSIVGPTEQVMALWMHLEPAWGPPRQVRPDQPLLATSSLARQPPDPGVRLVTDDEVDVLLPACVRMFNEEVGVSPLLGDGGTAYRQRVAELVHNRYALARIEKGRVLFKAEVGAVTPHACQVQGVWVDPEVRGTGLGIAGMAAVVAHALAHVAPTVSLYVNDYNHAARAVYERTGFTQRGTFASVLF